MPVPVPVPVPVPARLCLAALLATACEVTQVPAEDCRTITSENDCDAQDACTFLSSATGNGSTKGARVVDGVCIEDPSVGWCVADPYGGNAVGSAFYLAGEDLVMTFGFQASHHPAGWEPCPLDGLTPQCPSPIPACDACLCMLEDDGIEPGGSSDDGTN